MKSSFLFSLVFALSLAAASAEAPMPERIRLYEAPDPTATGGLKGQISEPRAPIVQILAIPTGNPEPVYQGTISGVQSDCFEFKGLPVGKYDLVVAYDKDFYEAITLMREQNSLTPEDVKKIQSIIEVSEPFFTKKFIHRLEGESGRGKFARAVCTFFRDKGSDFMMSTYKGEFKRADFRHTYKIVTLKDVGPGWQLIRARDLYPTWLDPKHPLPKHHFSAALSQIRVADSIKDLGNLNLISSIQ